MEFERRIKDGRTLRIAHVERTDAAEMVAYVNRACGESDYPTSGPGEFEITVADKEKFIDGLEGGRFNFMLKGVVNGEIVSLCQIASTRLAAPPPLRVTRRLRVRAPHGANGQTPMAAVCRVDDWRRGR